MRRLNPFATLSTLVVVGALAVAWASRGRQRPAGATMEVPQASPFSAEPFTANLTIQKASGAIYHGKMFVGRSASRTDVEMEPGKTASVIVRYDRNLTWILMPAGHYLQAPISDEDALFTLLRKRSPQLRRKDLGPEQVGAYACEKYQIEASIDGQRRTGLIWVARAPAMHGFVVKAERGQPASVVTLSDIRLGMPNPSEFQLPAGYHQLSPASGSGNPH